MATKNETLESQEPQEEMQQHAEQESKTNSEEQNEENALGGNVIAAVADSWQVAEYGFHEDPDHDPDELLNDPLEIDKLLDESRTTIWAVKGSTKIRFVVRKLTSTEMAIFLETLFGISAYLNEKDERTREERLAEAEARMEEVGAVTLYDKILLATEAAIEEPLGIKAEMLPNWPEELVNKLTNAATGGAFGDTAQIRFLKDLDERRNILRANSVGQDSDEIQDASDGNPEEV